MSRLVQQALDAAERDGFLVTWTGPQVHAQGEWKQRCQDRARPYVVVCRAKVTAHVEMLMPKGVELTAEAVEEMHRLMAPFWPYGCGSRGMWHFKRVKVAEALHLASALFELGMCGRERVVAAPGPTVAELERLGAEVWVGHVRCLGWSPRQQPEGVA